MENFIKKPKSSLFLFFLFLLTASCKDYNSLDIQPVDSGNADFTSYVAVGNSLTAGYQNGALYESAQQYSFPNLIARQLGISDHFTQPLISDPGIGGRIELTSLDPIQTTRNTSQGNPLNQSVKPFTNLGIPGAVLVDYVNPNNSGQLKERATDPSNPAYNPFYGIVLEQSELAKAAPNIHNEVAKQNPTFITFWLGSNDILNYVTSGGEGQAPTTPSNFDQLYQASVQALASTGANVVVYNIPDVTTIPFVFYLRTELEQEGAIILNGQTQTYQLVTPNGNFDIYIQTDDGTRVMRQYDFPLLSASDYFAQIQAGQATPPIDANGDGTPESAIPDQLVLDGPAGGPQGSSELEQAAGIIMQYNNSIQNAANAADFAEVNINNIFSQIFETFQSSQGQQGYTVNGIVLRPVPGELFSFDGIHPSNRGEAVLANETIKAVNDSFGANVPLINISKIPEGFPVASGK